MAVTFHPKEGDILAGGIGLRGPDGSVVKTVYFYRKAGEGPEGVREEPEGLTRGEKDVCDGIVRDMARMFGEYVESAKALDGIT